MKERRKVDFCVGALCGENAMRVMNVMVGHELGRFLTYSLLTNRHEGAKGEEETYPHSHTHTKGGVKILDS